MVPTRTGRCAIPATRTSTATPSVGTANRRRHVVKLSELILWAQAQQESFGDIPVACDFEKAGDYPAEIHDGYVTSVDTLNPEDDGIVAVLKYGRECFTVTADG